MQFFNSMPVTQESAREINGRKFIRLHRTSAGIDIFAWREIPPPPTSEFGPQARTGWSADGDYLTRFNRALASGKTSIVAPADPEADELARELEKLRELRLTRVAAIVAEAAKDRKAKVPSGGLFEPGDVHLHILGARLLAIQTDEVQQAVKRHIAGDAGDHGSEWAQIELTDDQTWCPPLYPIAVQNAAALKLGHGFVRSRFGLYDPARDRPKPEDSRKAVDPRRRGPGEVLEVVTLLTPGRPNRTLVYSTVDHVQL